VKIDPHGQHDSQGSEKPNSSYLFVSPYGLIMVALCNRGDHYIFAL